MKTISTFLFVCLCLTSRADERIMVEGAKVNGAPARLAFDTGADGIYFFSPAPERLKLKVLPLRNIWGQKIGRATEKCTVEFWGFSEKQRIPVVELRQPNCGCDDLDGLIGWEAVSDKILVFDTLSNSVRVVREVPPEVKQWTKLKLKLSSFLILQVADRGQTGQLAIDTGSESGFGLPPARWQEWKRAHASQPLTFDTAYMPGPQVIIAREQAWASDLTLGPLQLSDVVVEEADPFTARNTGTKHAATLGLAALKRLDLVVDGRHGVAYVRPKKSPFVPLEHNRLGATFPPRDFKSSQLIARVATGSPAYEAGIRPGDELLKAGDRDMTKWRTMTNSRSSLLEQPAGTRIELTLRRSNETFRTAVILRDILPPKTNVP